jgi:predicted dehydrogenase
MKKMNLPTRIKNKGISRRDFVSKAGAVAAFTIVPRNAIPGSGYAQPSDMINIAGIGIGAQGGVDLLQVSNGDVDVAKPPRTNTGQPLSKEQIAEQAARAAQPQPAAGAPAVNQLPSAPRRLANIYALCDVDTEFAGYVIKRYPKAKTYNDWRILLEKEKSIDAVIIATPDHNHATIAAPFIREKKHVFLEKPMTKTIFECRKLAQLAKEYDIVTQMGNQGRATDGTRQTVEWIQSGVIGSVREVHLFTTKPVWPQGNLKRPAGVTVPKTLNYDVWLGPAPVKPYHPEITHFNWRGLWDYGTGTIGDMGAHIFDAPVWALNLDYPKKVQASSSPYSSDYYPQCEMVTYEFAARGIMPEVKVTWFDGGIMPPRPAGIEPGRGLLAAIFYGDKGVIMQRDHGGVPELVPADKNFKGPDPWLPRTGDIYADWITAIRNNKKSCNDFSVAAKLTEIMLLSNVAVASQKANVALEYDHENMKITNLPAANNLFHYEYRAGWSL